MKVAFLGGLIVAGLLIAWSTMLPTSPPTSRINLPVFVLSCGVTLAVTFVAIALWFLPTLWALRKVRAANPDGAVLVCQRTRETVKGLDSLGLLMGEQAAGLSAYFVVSVSAEALEIWRPVSFLRIARIPSSALEAIALEVVNIPKAVPAFAILCETEGGAQGRFTVIPCKPGSELFAMSRTEAEAARRRVLNILGRL